MGTNKRYADSIDRRSVLRVDAAAEPAAAVTAHRPSGEPVLRDWQPPWPPIRTGEAEWIIMRDSISEPAAIIRIVRIGPRNAAFYRVVTWAPSSEGRALIGYFATLAEADRAVLFSPSIAKGDR